MTDISNIQQRKLAVMRDVERVSKDRYNPHHKYSFAGHDDVALAIRKAMVVHGITQEVSVVESTRSEGIFYVNVRVRWVNVDDPKDFVEVTMPGESQPSGKGGAQPQQVGVAVSYAVKVAQLKNFMLLGDDTPDVEAQDDGRNQRSSSNGSNKFDQYAEMFRTVKLRPEFEALMSIVAKSRHDFSQDQMAELQELAREADRRTKPAPEDDR